MYNSRFAKISDIQVKDAIKTRKPFIHSYKTRIHPFNLKGKISSLMKDYDYEKNYDDILNNLIFSCNPHDPKAYGVWVKSWRNGYRTLMSDIRTLKTCRVGSYFSNTNDPRPYQNVVFSDIEKLRLIANKMLHLRTVNKLAFKQIRGDLDG